MIQILLFDKFDKYLKSIYSTNTVVTNFFLKQLPMSTTLMQYTAPLGLFLYFSIIVVVIAIIFRKMTATTELFQLEKELENLDRLYKEYYRNLDIKSSCNTHNYHLKREILVIKIKKLNDSK